MPSASETWHARKVQTVKTVGTVHGVTKFFEQVGQNQNVEDHVVTSVVAHRLYRQMMPHFMRARILLVVDVFVRHTVVEGHFWR